MALTLYTETKWDSPWVFTIVVALLEKGLAYEEKELDLGGPRSVRQSLQNPFRDASITAKVPAIEHDGFWLSESLAIVEYLDETFPAPGHRPLLPPNLRERARARQVMGWIRSAFTHIRDERPTSSMFHRGTVAPLTAKGEQQRDDLIRGTRLFLEGRNTVGSAWSIADAELSFTLNRLVLNDDAMPDDIVRYAKTHWERPSVQAFARHPRPPHPTP